MEKVMVLLVGGRQFPNILGRLLLKPDRIEFIASKDELQKVKALSVIFNSVGSIKVSSTIYEICANDFEANKAAFKDICEKYKGEEIYLNITCGTKIMALAAYEIARQYENTKVFYLDTSGNKIIWIKGAGERSEIISMNIKAYLEAYNRRAHYKVVFDGYTFSKKAACDAARILAHYVTISNSILDRVRQIKGGGRSKILLKNPYEKSVADLLLKEGVVDAGDDCFFIRTNEDRNFFNGTWLEIYIWNEARQLQDKEGKPLFNDVAVSLEIPSGFATKEIDVACIYRNQLIHCSCKSGKSPFKTSYLDELSAVSDLMGGRFCSRIFITNQMLDSESSQERQQWDLFKEQANQREIVIIKGDELAKAGDILKKQAINPDFSRV